MKEVVLRILSSGKDPITGMNRKRNECVFHCSIAEEETLLQEEIHFGHVVGLRVRQLSNPPPEMTLKESYNFVTKLELSCPVSINWVFSVTSILPGLSFVRFGASCFEIPFGDCSPIVNQSWLTKCPSVKELIISFDHRKLLQTEYDTNSVTECLDEILEYSTKYFPSLIKADMYLPASVKLDNFLKNNQFLASTGDKRPHPHLGMVRFQSHSYAEKKKLCNISRSDSHSSGDGPQVALVGPRIILQDPRKEARLLKRNHSKMSEASSDATEDDMDDPKKRIRSNEYSVPPTPPSPSSRSTSLILSPPPVLQHDYEHGSLVMDHMNSAFYSKHPINGGKNNGYDSLTSSETPALASSYSDFTQMFTRRS